jgi:hypothetical protein
MQYSTDENSLLLETNQRRDTFIHTRLGDHISARLFSMRCQEAQTQTLLNQDYACLLSLQDASSLCFCVCDGVGSSYRGDFAAQYLAGQLLTWLQEMPEIPSDLDLLSRTLHDLLDLWAHNAHVLLGELVIPSETPALVREVLEELRDTAGSETVFLCGRIDAIRCPPHAPHPHRPHVAQAFFCWMGNVTARLSLSANRCIILGDQKDDKNRWSTTHSCRGQITIWRDSLATLEHLTIYTDGLDTVGEKLALSTDEEWQEHAQRLLLLPQNDDMTALEFCWLDENKGPAS